MEIEIVGAHLQENERNVCTALIRQSQPNLCSIVSLFYLIELWSMSGDWLIAIHYYSQSTMKPFGEI